MSLLQDITYISLRGSKESVIRMLNAVIRNVGNGDIITDRDDLETISHKIKDEKDGNGFRISIPDLLDDKCLEDSQLLEKKEEYEKRNDEDEEGEFYTDERMIDILRVFDDGLQYRIEFEMYECENCAYYKDWLNWGDIARIYGCKVFVDNDLYRNGKFEKFCGTAVYTPKGESVEESHFTPEPIRIDVTKEDDNNDDVRTVGNGLIDENGHAVIPEGADKIEERSFEDCSGLISIEIPGSVRRIGWASFCGCTGLTSIVIPEGVTVIEEMAFKGCKSLTEVSIPQSMEEICFDAFEGCPCEAEILEKYKDKIN